jgi:hypothetical protein
MQVFLAIAFHDLDEHVQAMETPLLRNLAETSSDPEISACKEAQPFSLRQPPERAP